LLLEINDFVEVSIQEFLKVLRINIVKLKKMLIFLLLVKKGWSILLEIDGMLFELLLFLMKFI
jgi:hypothetical protein